MYFRLCTNRLICLFALAFATSCSEPVGWAAYYGDNASPRQLNDYGLVVLDRHYPYDLKTLKNNHTRVIGYLSIGEVTTGDPWFEKTKSNGLLLHENPRWKGSHTVDIRNPLWQQIILQEALPSLLSQGFEGVMLDTLDSPLALEKTKAGMHAAAKRLVKEIRQNYPQLIIIQNRGYEVLEDTAPDLNYVIAESTFTNVGGDDHKYLLREQAEQDYALNYLQKARAAAPKLRVLGLEYWDPSDKKMNVQLFEKMCKNNMLPFVSVPSLNQIKP